MNDHELKTLINAPQEIRVGDVVVRVARQTVQAAVPVGALARISRLSHSGKTAHLKAYNESRSYMMHINTPTNNWQRATPAQIAEFEERERRERS